MAKPVAEKIHNRFCGTHGRCQYGPLLLEPISRACRELDDLLAALLTERVGQQAHEPVVEFRVETFFDLWMVVGGPRHTVEEAREAREQLRPRAPEQRWRIVRWDETSTVIETDSES